MWLRVAILVGALTCTDCRLCCPENLILNTTSVECEPPESNIYTTLFLKDITFGPSLPDCEQPTDRCYHFEDNSIVELDCNLKATLIQKYPSHLRLCCPYGHVYSSRVHACRPDKDFNSTITQVLWSIAPKQFLLLKHGPLHQCLIDKAIVDTPVELNQITLDDSISGFYVEGHPELMGDQCLALHDGDNSLLVVRTCLSSRHACSHGRICLRRCCPDGESVYNPMKECRNKWKAFPAEVYEGSDFDTLRAITPEPFQFAMMHGIKCIKYPLIRNTSGDTWHLLKNGTMLRDKNINLNYNNFCIENMDYKKYVGMTGFICGSPVPVIPMDYAKGAGFIISCFFLIITIIVYVAVPRFHNLHGKTLICYAFWMLNVYAFLSVIYFINISGVTCAFIGFFVYFSFISASSWMNIMCFDIWWSLGGPSRTTTNSPGTKRKRENHRFAYYAIYASVVASVLTSICLFAQYSPHLIPRKYSPNISIDNCFLSAKGDGKLIYYVIPLSIMYFVNIIFFILTVRNFLKIRNEIERLRDTTKEGKKRKLTNDMSKFATNAKLFIVMGVVWMFEVISVRLNEESWVWYLPDMANALHGLLIFIIYVLKRSVLKELKIRFCNKRQNGGNQRKDMYNSSGRSLSTSTTRI